MYLKDLLIQGGVIMDKVLDKELVGLHNVSVIFDDFLKRDIKTGSKK